MPRPERSSALRNRIWCDVIDARARGFSRFLDGNSENGSVDNMTNVKLLDALAHPEWVVDWDFTSSEEIEYFERNREHFHAQMLNLDVPCDQVDKYSTAVCNVDRNELDYIYMDQNDIKIEETILEDSE